MGTIQVLIADDSREFRENARMLLEREEGIEMVAKAPDGRAPVGYLVKRGEAGS